ncbi:MAG: tetratricopeptide repeat protein [Flavobacteriales bacterium]
MKKSALVIACSSLLFACGGGTSETADAKMLEARDRIRSKEDSLFEHRAFDERSALAMVDVYKAYAAAYPLDSMAPEYLFRAAGMYKSNRQPDQAITLYDRITHNYQSWRRRVDVLYMKALTLDDDLDQDGEAERIYKQVINEYPDHPFARDARAMIENLGLTNEELISKFKAMNEGADQEAEAAR